MDLKGIISISGRPGLFKIVTQGKSNVIVESLIDKKRFPAFASEKISSIEDISIFTYDEDVKLTEVFSSLLTLNEGKEGINHKVDEPVLRKTFEGILPNYDIDRVYLSDIRKVFQWYNLLLKEGLLTVETEPAKSEEKTEKEPKKVKADATKKPSKPAASKETKAVKPAVSKKAPVVKTGSSRGK
ncbi:MAG: DUF5606 domain-containing protein [Flavobacteriales bacterium]